MHQSESFKGLRKKVLTLPYEPGVYMMKDKEDKIIYIGKAKNLRKRVLSYFNFRENHDASNWKTFKLVSKIQDVDFLVTDNEIEAFLLESNLIKQYRPLFNIDLKDQQRYTYLKISDEKFPRLLVARRNRDGKFTGTKGKVFGPFVHGSSKLLTIGLLRKIFKIRICNTLPKKPCLEYFINNCDAPCINNVTQNEYMEYVQSLENILAGKKSIDDFIEKMKEDMTSASSTLEYEKAKAIRDTVSRLENLRSKQKIEQSISSRSEEEYVGIKYDLLQSKAHILILRRYRGVIRDRKKYQFDLVGDNSFSTFLSQYYYSKSSVPRFIYVNEQPDSKQVLEKSLERIASHKVNIITLSNRIDVERKQLMNLIIRNLSTYISKGFEPGLLDLKKVLSLKSLPKIIDCFDVSNLGFSIAVGSCVRFVNGNPEKSFYRKFRIKTIKDQNDFAMIREIVSRRYSKEDKLNLPDLVLIDGGKGQLNSALEAISKLDLKVPCISIAKEREEIFVPNSVFPILIPKNSKSLKILQYLRDEAHRFGLSYNIKLRDLK
ncbi:MAG: excinuclease ABC subunit UvrC [Nitrososphaeraceae archaeon]|nr:excinuclease ABC subunit UvrC [Nitrososphaeraceae archaeon]MDW0307406.1 excinuclease ABC subunit UvrC [Nitrososphaeraceae archaeon]